MNGHKGEVAVGGGDVVEGFLTLSRNRARSPGRWNSLIGWDRLDSGIWLHYMFGSVAVIGIAFRLWRAVLDHLMVECFVYV